MRWNNRPKMKMSLWYLFTADRSIRTPERRSFSTLNIFWKNPLYIEIACLLCQSLEYADNILSRWSYKTDRLYNSLKICWNSTSNVCLKKRLTSEKAVKSLNVFTLDFRLIFDYLKNCECFGFQVLSKFCIPWFFNLWDGVRLFLC